MAVRKSYHVEQWQAPHWRVIGGFRDREAAIAIARKAGGKTRITEHPGGKVVWTSEGSTER
jgi:hypothetical protein